MVEEKKISNDAEYREEEEDNVDYVAEAYYAVDIFTSLHANDEVMDAGLLSKEDNKRIKSIKRMALRIAHENLKYRYNELFGPDDDDKDD